MNSLMFLFLVLVVIAIPLGMNGSVAAKKAKIEKKAKLLGYDLTFDNSPLSEE